MFFPLRYDTEMDTFYNGVDCLLICLNQGTWGLQIQILLFYFAIAWYANGGYRQTSWMDDVSCARNAWVGKGWWE